MKTTEDFEAILAGRSLGKSETVSDYMVAKYLPESNITHTLEKTGVRKPLTKKQRKVRNKKRRTAKQSRKQ
jgi:hypothetical protein